MKFLVTSDWHIGKNLYGNENPYTGFHTQGSILLDGVRSLICHARNSDIKHVFVVGDIFHRRNPWSIDWLLFSEILDLFKENEIHLYISPGNHDDLTTYTTALNPLWQIDSEYLHFIETSSVLTLESGVEIYIYSYVSKRWSKNKSFVNLIQSIPPRDSIVKRVCLCHEMIDGASYNGITFETYLKPSLLEKAFDLTIAGHVHQYQQIRSNVFYTGVLVHQEYGDADSKAGFLEVEVTVASVQVKKIDLVTRELFKIEGTAKEVLKEVQSKDYANQVLKLIITDKQTEISRVIPELKSLEKDDTVVLIETHPLTKKTVRKELASSLTNTQQFEEYCKHKELVQEVVSVGKQILEDVTE